MKAALSLITARQNASGVLAGFDALPGSLLKTNPGFVVSSAERLILSERPKGGRFTIHS